MSPGRLRAALLCTLAAQPLGAVERIEAEALLKDLAVLSVDGKRRTVRAGETTPEGVTLIESNSRAAVIEIQGQRRTLTLGTRIGSTFSAPREQQVRVHADAAGMYRVDGGINGAPVEFLLDTGATLVSINEVLAARLGLDYRRLGKPGQSMTAAGMVKIWRIRLTRVRAGEVELLDVEAAVHEGAFPPVALLGNSFLSRVDMARENGAVTLRRRF